MTKKTKHIRIVEFTNRLEMESELNGFLQGGWDLHGELKVVRLSSRKSTTGVQTIDTNSYIQAVTRTTTSA